MRLATRVGTIAVLATLVGGWVGTSSSVAAQWSAPSKVHGVTMLRAVSCVSRSFCMAVGDGKVVAYRSGVWGHAKKIDSHAGFNSGLVTVSCTSPTFCAAGDGSGDVFIYDGSHWSSPTEVMPDGLSQLSCATATFCGVVDIVGNASFYDGSSWSAPQRIAPPSQATLISCPLTGFCMALDGTGPSAYRLSGGSWVRAGSINPSEPQGGSEPNVPSAVSCSGNRFCVALDDFGEAFTWKRGSGWSGPHRFDGNLLAGSDAVSCRTRRACMAVDAAGVASRWNGSGWSPKQQIDPSSSGLMGVSCSAARFCIAVDLGGRALIYQ